MSVQIGSVVGQYEITGHVGKGGMATVYRGHHTRLGRDVAIKVMHPGLSQDDNFQMRFEREARIVAQLDHAHIVTLYDFDEHEGQPYLAMKYIAGPTLKRYALKRGLSLAETEAIMRQLATALDYAHSKDVLHRDLKPSNVLIDANDKPHLTDFGLARLTQSGESTMSQDMMLGTPYYISPEQAQGSKAIDHRTDLYSFAVILYELISGHVPFTGDTPYAIVHGHIYEKPAEPSYHNAELTDAIDAVLMRAMAKDPNKRYNSATELMDAFADALKNTSDDVQQSSVTPIDLPKMGDDSTIPPQISVPQNPAQKSGAMPVPPSPPKPRKPPTPVPSDISAPKYKTGEDGRQMQVESSLDLGGIDLSQVGKRIETGVQNLASLIEERIDSELKIRNSDLSLTEEEKVRREVQKQMKARREFASHLSIYLAVNGGVIAIWLFTGAGFFWPFFPLFLWGMGVFGQGYEYYDKYGGGRERREEMIEREVERKLERSMTGKAKKEKNDGDIIYDYDDGANDGISLSRLDDAVGNVRLNDEGELTDSFIDERQSERNHRN